MYIVDWIGLQGCIYVTICTALNKLFKALSRVILLMYIIYTDFRIELLFMLYLHCVSFMPLLFLIETTTK